MAFCCKEWKGVEMKYTKTDTELCHSAPHTWGPADELLQQF
jgi:hypothetical protein